MSRYATQSDQDAQPTFEGDSRFTGLYMKPDRGTLQAGQYSDGLNYRCVTGEMRKRAGSIMPAFANIVAFGAIVGSGIYSDPRGARQLLIATPDKVRTMTAGGYPTEIAIPETLQDRIYFNQAFDKVLLTRGEAKRPMQWTGLPTTGFELVTKLNPADTSTVVLPNIDRGVAFQARFLFPIPGTTNAGLTDIRDYTSTDPILESFPINLGTSDRIVVIFPYAKNAAVVGKENRLELLADFTDPLHPENAHLEVLSSTIGTCSWDSWAMTGADALFWSKPNGVYRIGEVIQDRISAGTTPVSDPIESLIRRVNWLAGARIVSIMHGLYYVTAFPIDGSTVNNCLAWFNTATNEWEGYDTFAAGSGMQIDALHLFDYNGVRRLYAINYAAGSIHLLEEGKYDVTKAGSFEVNGRWASRGYATVGWNGATGRSHRRAEIGIRTWAPQFTVTELTDRANDPRILTAQPYTRDPRKWNTWNRAPFDLTNETTPHGSPGRQDYSIDLPEDPDADIPELEGADPELKQADVLRFATVAEARYVSLQIDVARGDCDITGVLMESVGSDRRAIRRAA